MPGGASTIDTERYRLRRFVERLIELGEVEVHDDVFDAELAEGIDDRVDHDGERRRCRLPPWSGPHFTARCQAAWARGGASG